MRTSHLSFSDMRPLVRSATLNGYWRAGEIPRSRRGAVDAQGRAGPRRPRRPGQVDLGGRGGPAPRRIGHEVGSPGLRDAAGRGASALHLGATERGAAGGARSAQRAESPPPLRAQLQRGPPDAAGGVGGDSHAAALVRVRRTRTLAAGTRSGCCGAARDHARVRRPGLAAAGDLLLAARAGGSRDDPSESGPGVQFEHDFTGIVFYARDLDAANSLSDPLMRPVCPAVAGLHGLAASRRRPRPGCGSSSSCSSRSASAP